MRILLGILMIVMATQAALQWGSIAMKDHDVQVSAVALNEEYFAVGLVRDGVRIYDPRINKCDSINIPDFGAKRRILDLKWWRSWLLIASENGLTIWDVRRKSVVVHLNSKKLNFNSPGAFSLYVRGSDLWVGGLGQVAQVHLEQKKLQSTWKVPGNAGRAQSLLALGSSLYVGTEGNGVQVLDLGRSSWMGYDQFDGLPSNQITGLELVGTRVIVGTAQGIGKIDLPTQSASVVDSNIVVTYMTQDDGKILLSSLDGLWLLDGTLLKLTKLEIQKNPVVQGDLSVRGRELVTGTESSGVIRMIWSEGILGLEPAQLMSQGVLFTLQPNRMQKQDVIGVRIWYPERATAEISLETLPGTSVEERLVRLPSDAVGHFILEIGIFRGKDVLERRTYQFYRDRTLPMLEMEGIAEFTKDSILKVRGKIMERGSPVITVEPMNSKVKLDSTGVMETTIQLAKGMNSWEVVVRDASGNELRYPMQIICDREPPKLSWQGPDTISSASGNWKIPIQEANLKSVSVKPEADVLIAVTDSLILMTAQKLKSGINKFEINAEDAAGNQTNLKLKILFQDERSRIVQSMDAKKVEPVTITKIDTVYRCTTSTTASLFNEAEAAKSCPSIPSTQDIRQIRYKLKYGETLRSVAEKFYGNRELYIVIAENNGILDPEDWYRLPVGKPLWIPFWQDIEYGSASFERLIESYRNKVKK